MSYRFKQNKIRYIFWLMVQIKKLLDFQVKRYQMGRYGLCYQWTLAGLQPDSNIFNNPSWYRERYETYATPSSSWWYFTLAGGVGSVVILSLVSIMSVLKIGLPYIDFNHLPIYSLQVC